MLSSKCRFVLSDFPATLSGPSPFFLDMCSQVASVCICLLCYSMRPAPGPVPPAAPGVPSGPSGTWTHIIKTYKDDVERQVELSGDSDSAIRNSPRLVAPQQADYSRLQQTKLLFGTRKAVGSPDSDIESSCAEAVLLSMKISLRLRPLPGGPVLPAAPRVPSGPWGTTTTHRCARLQASDSHVHVHLTVRKNTSKTSHFI